MKRYKNNRLKIAIVSLLFWSLGAHAQIVYQVDRSVGAGTVKGTIETDGTIGSLTPSNILSWSLEADDGSGLHAPITIGGSVSGEGLTGDGDGWSFFSATESELLFDFDGAYASGPIASVQFYGDGGLAEVSVNYAFGASAEFGYGKKENLVHFFPGDSHYAESFRDGVIVVGTTGEPIAYCSGSSVGVGEVMSGLQAGLTGGAHSDSGNPEGFFAAASEESRRGFIVPEAEVASRHCDRDYILIAEWFGCPLTNFAGENIRNPEEARDCVDSGLGGLIVDWHLEIDGVRVDHMRTATKMGVLPNGRRAAIFNAGHFVEPYSLAPGAHTATAVFEYDLDCRQNRGGVCDGIVDYVWAPTANFEIVKSATDAP